MFIFYCLLNWLVDGKASFVYAVNPGFDGSRRDETASQLEDFAFKITPQCLWVFILPLGHKGLHPIRGFKFGFPTFKVGFAVVIAYLRFREVKVTMVVEGYYRVIALS